MISKQSVLSELPLKKHKDEIVPASPEFKDLYRQIKSLRLDEPALEFFKREVIAKRESLGFVAGLNVRRLIDGEWKHVNP